MSINEFNPKRWCMEMSKWHIRRKEYDIASTFRSVAEYIDNLSEVNATLRARVARLEEALRRGIELHENCDADTCMCGEPMHHPLSDHMLVAILQYYGDQWAEEAKSALEEK